MKETVHLQAKAMKKLNDLSLQGEIVVFGSTYMSDFPLYELINKCTFENAVYNRSIAGLTVSEALEIAADCVIELHPSKILLALGEEDENNPNAAEEYAALVSGLRTQLPGCELYIIGLTGNGSYEEHFNRKLKALCKDKMVKYIDFINRNTSETALYRARFKQLSCCFRSKPLNMCDAFGMGGV